ncbi:MAG TPA: arsenate reductase ArsC [Vicinamibacterales bacterium]|jgi:arsenate reductase|nr:arsenate reductase ArsC [Vicinamibacterales bacterium]
MAPLRVLFLCTGNSARSQMAEALLRSLSGGAIDVHSAGTHPQPHVHPMAKRTLERRYGLATDGLAPKTMDRYLGQHFDYVITVCDRAAESCPVFPGAPERIHWSFPDPAAAAGTPDEQQRAFDTVAAELAGRLRLWLSLPAVATRLRDGRADSH